MEAIAVKVRAEDEKARKDAEKAEERSDFKKDTKSLDQFR